MKSSNPGPEICALRLPESILHWLLMICHTSSKSHFSAPSAACPSLSLKQTRIGPLGTQGPSPPGERLFLCACNWKCTQWPLFLTLMASQRPAGRGLFAADRKVLKAATFSEKKISGRRTSVLQRWHSVSCSGLKANKYTN